MPLPVPVAPDVTAIQAASLVAVLAQPAAEAVTATVPSPPPEPNAKLSGAIVNVQLTPILVRNTSAQR